MKNGAGGRSKSGISGKSGKKSDTEKNKSDNEKDTKNDKGNIFKHDKFDSSLPYYSNTRTALAPVNLSPWKEDRPPIVGLPRPVSAVLYGRLQKKNLEKPVKIGGNSMIVN